ncbi:hypothetical protein [Nonomuraea africana]|uniref:Uncharacterized protein n=1 Tax=Nonomuraea africana TaxID=46171 RepID=A0ABR9KMJ9_9ACTN|nr:hypothetical protein [Nonomuraea africana]MBE1563251.1 hypothetical protein [Nonomuraea africana]
MVLGHILMLLMGVLVVGGMGVALVVMVHSGVRTGEWPVHNRRRVVWRGFVVR